MLNRMGARRHTVKHQRRMLNRIAATLYIYPQNAAYSAFLSFTALARGFQARQPLKFFAFPLSFHKMLNRMAAKLSKKPLISANA